MGEFSFARRDSAPFFQDVLRPMRVRDGDVLEPATSPQWTQPWFGLNVAAEAARPRLPSIREMLGETESAEINNAGNGGPSPSTVADSPGPATPGGHYTHLRHGSWPRTHSLDSYSGAPFEDRSAPPGRIDFEGAEQSRLSEECRLPVSPRSYQNSYPTRRAQQPATAPEQAAWGARANSFSHGGSDEPRVLPSDTTSPEHWLSEWRPLVAVGDRERAREEELELARRHQLGEQRQHLHGAQPDNGCWMSTLALREQTHDPIDRIPASQRAMFSRSAPCPDHHAVNRAAPAHDFRSPSDAFAPGFYRPPRHGHSRSMSFLHDRPAPWSYDAYDENPYRVGAGGPGNPFAHPASNPYPGGPYGVPPGYHAGGHLERGDGSGPLAEMAKRKKRGNLPPEAKKKMMAWFKTHLHHPYPDEETKKRWIIETGLSPEQISNYCINARRRDIKNMRHEAQLSPQMPSELATSHGDSLNHRKRRSADESSMDGQLVDSESDKRRRRH